MESKTKSRLIIAATLKEATVSYFLKKGYSCSIEQGLTSWGKLRADVICINLRGEIVICEIKSSKHDYLSDKKWEAYLPYCNKLLFVMLPEVFEYVKDNLLPRCKLHGVGVLVLDKNTGYLKSRVSVKRKLMKKRNKRLLTIRLAWRQGISKRNSRRKRQFLSHDILAD